MLIAFNYLQSDLTVQTNLLELQSRPLSVRSSEREVPGLISGEIDELILTSITSLYLWLFITVLNWHRGCCPIEPFSLNDEHFLPTVYKSVCNSNHAGTYPVKNMLCV